MKTWVHSLALCFLFNCSTWGWSEEPQIDALPHRIADKLSMDLRVREVTESGQRRLAVIVSMVAEQSLHLFNPFGKPELGRPFRVVMTDSHGTVLHTVVHGSSGAAIPPDHENWIGMNRGGVVGRCFWTQDQPGQPPRDPGDLAQLPVASPGKYFLVLLVSKRLLHFPYNPDRPQWFQDKWNATWNDPSQDDSCGASLPVEIEVDEMGVYHPVYGANSDGAFQVLESDPIWRSDGFLSLIVRLVNPEKAWLVMPVNLFEPRRRSVHTSMTRVDGNAFDRFPYLRGGSYELKEPEIRHAELVPRDGVVGGTQFDAGTPDMPGQYLITTTIDESIFKDKLFVNGKKVNRKPGEWPIVFRSRTTTITVSEKAP